MGNVLVIAKLYPAGVEEVEIVEQGVKKLSVGKVTDVKKEPLAFGMSTIKVGIVIPDKQEGLVDKVENALKNLKGVNEVEIEGVTLV